MVSRSFFYIQDLTTQAKLLPGHRAKKAAKRGANDRNLRHRNRCEDPATWAPLRTFQATTMINFK